MDTTVADPLVGTTIDGRYRITGRVARGGMATVYTASDERLDRTVALKIIHPSQATNVHFVDRFTDEAKTIARLTHPHVVAVYDQGRHEGLPYLVMEYVHGHTLREVLTRRRRLNPVEALAILEQMLSAIAAAHRAGLVHRDVKPENVLIAEAPSGGVGNLVDSVAKVADFGLARAVQASGDEESGQLLATVAYVAPELVSEGRADARSDVYAAGIVLFEMLTGRVPYDGDDPAAVAWRHVDEDVPPPSSVVHGLPPVLDELVRHATRRDPGARPTDAGAMLADVQTVRDDLGAANVETALLRQVPARRAADATAVVPAAEATALVPTLGGGVPAQQRPSWARLPEPARTRTGRRRAHGGRPEWLDRLLAGGDRLRVMVLAATALAVLVLLGTTWWVTIGRYTDAPQLVNMTQAQAEARARQDGFTVVVPAGSGAYSETVPKGTVLSQQPGADQRIVRGGAITLQLSLGPERYPVPDLAGVQADAARSRLTDSKLQVKEGQKVFSDTIPEGAVISTDPAAGTPLKPGATVTLVISRGQAPIVVPNLIGTQIADARARLEKLGATVVEEQVDDPGRPAGTVVDMTPPQGTGLDKGARITLKVSKGPPLVTIPDLTNQPCQQAGAQLQGLGLQARLDINPAGAVRAMTPGPNTPVPPGTVVALTCF